MPSKFNQYLEAASNDKVYFSVKSIKMIEGIFKSGKNGKNFVLDNPKNAMNKIQPFEMKIITQIKKGTYSTMTDLKASLGEFLDSPTYEVNESKGILTASIMENDDHEEIPMSKGIIGESYVFQIIVEFEKITRG
jgi:hypothetical protein